METSQLTPIAGGTTGAAGARVGYTHSLKHQRRQNGHLAPGINHKFDLGPFCPPGQEQGSSLAKSTHHNCFLVKQRRVLIGR